MFVFKKNVKVTGTTTFTIMPSNGEYQPLKMSCYEFLL